MTARFVATVVFPEPPLIPPTTMITLYLRDTFLISGEYQIGIRRARRRRISVSDDNQPVPDLPYRGVMRHGSGSCRGAEFKTFACGNRDAGTPRPSQLG